MNEYGRRGRGGGRRGGRDEEEEEEVEVEYEYDQPRERSRGREGGGGGRGGGGGGGGGQEKLQRLDSIQDPGKRYQLRDRFGSGVCGDVYEAIDEEAGNFKISLRHRRYPPGTESTIPWKFAAK